MKFLRDLEYKEIEGDKWFSEKMIKSLINSNMVQIVSNNPQIKLDQIKSVGILDGGKFQFKVPETFKNRQVVLLLAYLKEFIK